MGGAESGYSSVPRQVGHSLTFTSKGPKIPRENGGQRQRGTTKMRLEGGSCASQFRRQVLNQCVDRCGCHCHNRQRMDVDGISTFLGSSRFKFVLIAARRMSSSCGTTPKCTRASRCTRVPLRRPVIWKIFLDPSSGTVGLN